MNKFMNVLMTLILATGGVFAVANELDNDSAIANQKQSLNGTVIVRIDHESNTTTMIHTNNTFNSNEEAQTFVANSEFQKIPTENLKKTELDNDGAASSWYYYSPYTYYPYGNYYYGNYFYYYGNYYNPCYYYNYGRFSYYYYSNNYWGW